MAHTVRTFGTARNPRHDPAAIPRDSASTRTTFAVPASAWKVPAGVGPGSEIDRAILDRAYFVAADRPSLGPAASGDYIVSVADRRIMMAFTDDEVHRLTGLSLRQIRYWAKDFYRPELGLYSFRDIVALRTLAKLRVHVPLQALRKASRELHKRFDRPWSRLRFYVSGRTIYFEDPGSGAIERAIPIGQMAIPGTFDIRVSTVERKTRADVTSLRRRPADQVGQIERRREIQSNAWCVKGTRVTTEAIAELAAAGRNPQEIVRLFPELKPEDVRAALEHQRKLGQRRRTG